jgi:spore germination cell wall hydrolase CwlJ-like protein
MIDVLMMARVLWGEARSEGIIGMAEVGHVIRNRWLDPRWPDTIADVCTQPSQFSCMAGGDANYHKTFAVDEKDRDYLAALAVAAGVLSSRMFSTRFPGANHYLTSELYRSDKAPSWAHSSKARLLGVLGAHTFLRVD